MTRRRGAPLVLGLVGSLVVPAAAASAPRCSGPAAALSCRPVAERPEWRRLVLDPQREVVVPRRVLDDRGGALRDPGRLARPDGRLLTVTADGSRRRALVLDLGRTEGGVVEVGLRRDPAASLRLAYSESRRFLGPTGDGESRFDVVDADGGTWRSPTVRGSQRWIAIDVEGRGRVALDFVRIRVAGLRPRTDQYAGGFHSSDPLLDRVWWAGARTFNLATERSAGRLFSLDGAKRDRLVWSGDLGVANLTAYSTTAAARRVVRDSLVAFACRQQPSGYLPAAVPAGTSCPLAALRRPEALPAPLAIFAEDGRVRLGGYVPIWIAAVARYHDYAGDRALVRALLPAMRRGLSWMDRYTRDGLYVVAPDRPEINWHPWDPATGSDAYANAAWYEALVRSARLERELGSPVRARRYERRAGNLRRAFLRRLWDERRGAVRLNTADPARAYGHDGNVYGALSGLLTPDRARRALRFVSRRLATRFGPRAADRPTPWMQSYISPYIASWEVWARFEAGDERGALRLVRRLFGHMVRSDPGNTLWERVAFDGGPAGYRIPRPSDGRLTPVPRGFTSLAHSWSTGPTSALSARVLGLRPAAPGWRRWLVAPRPAGLRWAQGGVPTPRGPLRSRWARTRAGDGFRLTVVPPRGTTGEIVVPGGGLRPVAMDGRMIWDGRRALGVRAARRGDDLRVLGLRGRHTLAWRDGAR